MPYYLDGPTLSQATSIYTDDALTICAPDGVYSDGSITRVLTECVLGPAKLCPSCGEKCDSELNFYDNETGVFRSTIAVGNAPGDIGAIIIRFDPTNYPQGFKAVYDGITYNSFSSPF